MIQISAMIQTASKRSRYSTILFFLLFSGISPRIAIAQKIPLSEILDTIFCNTTQFKLNDVYFVKSSKRSFVELDTSKICFKIHLITNLKRFVKEIHDDNVYTISTITEKRNHKDSLVVTFNLFEANKKSYSKKGLLFQGSEHYTINLLKVNSKFIVTKIIYPYKIQGIINKK